MWKRVSSLKHLLCQCNLSRFLSLADAFYPPRNRFPETCHEPGWEPSDPSSLSLDAYLREVAKLPFIARIARSHSDRAAFKRTHDFARLLILAQEVDLYCAHRPNTFRSCAVCEQGDRAGLHSCFHHFQSRIEFMPAGHATDAIRFDREFV